MNDEPKFTRGWRAAVIISLVLALAASSEATRKYEARSRRDEERLSNMEKAIQKIESYLYKEVAGSKQVYEEKSRQNEQRIVEIEKALKKIERPPQAQ
jgi:phage shock protein A